MCQALYPLLLSCRQEFNYFHETADQDPLRVLWVSQSSILDGLTVNSLFKQYCTLLHFTSLTWLLGSPRSLQICGTNFDTVRDDGPNLTKANEKKLSLKDIFHHFISRNCSKNLFAMVFLLIFDFVNYSLSWQVNDWMTGKQIRKMLHFTFTEQQPYKL